MDKQEMTIIIESYNKEKVDGLSLILSIVKHTLEFDD